ncbi:MAG: hypothetical protein K5660_04370 [Paludibacteraceae bacterium]|nr:hypothetical protein [Paludibacteraceae bacterium]
MKKSIFFAAMLFCIALGFASCEKDDITKPFTVETFAGIWCLPDTADNMKVTWYWELTKNGYLSYYEDDGEGQARYEKGYIVNDTGTDWRVRLRGEYSFDEATQTIYFGGIAMGKVQRTATDEAILTSSFLKSGKCYRIKGFK